MGRREDRAEREATWRVYEPAQPGTPFTKRDLAEAGVRALLRDLEVSDHGALRLTPEQWRDHGDELQRINPRVRYDATRGLLYEAA